MIQRKRKYLQRAAGQLGLKVHDVIGDGRCCPGVMAFQIERMRTGSVVTSQMQLQDMADDLRNTVCAGIQSDQTRVRVSYSVGSRVAKIPLPGGGGGSSGGGR